MRGFIKLCSGLFVIIGIVGFVLAAMVAIVTIKANPFGIAAFVVLASAAVTMVGGTAYLLCSIDERLERFWDSQTKTVSVVDPPAMKNAPAVHSKEW